MKKLYTMLAAAVAVSFGANAQDLTPVEVELANPSFEEEDAQAVIPHLTGWQTAGAEWYNEDGTDSFLAAFQQRNKSWTDGNWGLRSGTDVNIEAGGVYLFQDLLGQKPGTYVLQLDGTVVRNSWKGDLTAIEGAKGFAFICDDMGDPEEEGTAEEPAEGIACTYSTGHSNGDSYFDLARWYVVYTTHPDLEDETGLKIGFGVPVSSSGISKARISCDNVKLSYFDTMDTEAVKAWVNNQIAALERGDFAQDADGNPVPWTVVNPSGDVQLTLLGAVSNTNYQSQGVNDITVAPEFVGNNKYYNLQGIEVADPTQPGLYIHNGKKILVK